MKNRLLSSLLTLALLLGLCPVWQAPARAASSGTTDWSSLTSFKSGETYYISSPEDLKAFRNIVNQDAANTNGYGSTFLLTQDIVLHEPDCFVYNQQGHIKGKRDGAEVESWGLSATITICSTNTVCSAACLTGRATPSPACTATRT